MKLLPSLDRNGLIYRWVLVNFLLTAIISVIEIQNGWLSELLELDTYYISHAIIAAFLVFTTMSGVKAFRINKMIKNVPGLVAGYNKKLAEKGENSRSDLRESLKTDLMSYIAILSIGFRSLVYAGLVGTVIGLIVATAAIDPTAVADPSSAGPVVAQVISGYSIALHTTLVGAISGLWLEVNYYMFVIANSHVFSKVLRG